MFLVIQDYMQQIIEGVRGQNIQESQSMHDFGADSLEIVEVVSRSTRQLALRVPRTELARAKNIADLLDIFEQVAAAKPAL